MTFAFRYTSSNMKNVGISLAKNKISISSHPPYFLDLVPKKCFCTQIETEIKRLMFDTIIDRLLSMNVSFPSVFKAHMNAVISTFSLSGSEQND